MTDRIIDLSDTAAYVRVGNEQLIIERKDEKTVTVPLAETAALILANPRVIITQAALAGLARHGAALIACNEQSMPTALMLPTEAHFSQAERILAQAAASRPTNKRIWRQIVKEKIRAQSRLLMEVRGEDSGLSEMAKTVHSGDPANVEAQAARRYWPRLFDDVTFRRRREADDENRLLNYGYAVLRAVVARATCAAGLHPSLGLHHKNRYNAYALADDLMEPYRPVVDAIVVKQVLDFGKGLSLDKTAKRAMLAPLLGVFDVGSERRRLFDVVATTASSLAKTYLKQSDRLIYPTQMAYAEE